MAGQESKGSYWDKLDVINNHQKLVINFFSEFDTIYPGVKGRGVIHIAQEELSIWSVTRKKVFHDYQIYKKIRTFLEDHKVRIPEHEGGTIWLWLS